MLILGILLGLGIALVVHAQTTIEIVPPNTEDTNPWITDNVVYKPNPPSEENTSQPQPASKTPISNSNVSKVSGTSIRNTGSLSGETIRQYLESKGSPLAPYAERISQSPYSGTILGICTIEQYSCAKAPSFSPYNFWGIMKPGGGLAHYTSYEQGIDAIISWLTKNEPRHSTVQSLNGYYVVPASSSWLSTVLKTKTYLENYETQHQ